MNDRLPTYPWMLLLRLPDRPRTLFVECSGELVGAVAERADAVRQDVRSSEPDAQGSTSRRARDCVAIVRSYASGKLPLDDRSVDCLILRGAPGWLMPVPGAAAPGKSRLTGAFKAAFSFASRGDWRSSQIGMLREVRRVLAPDGQFVLLVPNRFDHAYFRGKPDPFTGLRFGPLLPRFIANAWLVLATGTPCRAWLHSLMEYRRCLRATGFASIETCGLTPNVERPASLIPFSVRGRAWRVAPTRVYSVRTRCPCGTPAALRRARTAPRPTCSWPALPAPGSTPFPPASPTRPSPPAALAAGPVRR